MSALLPQGAKTVTSTANQVGLVLCLVACSAVPDTLSIYGPL